MYEIFIMQKKFVFLSKCHEKCLPALEIANFALKVISFRNENALLETPPINQGQNFFKLLVGNIGNIFQKLFIFLKYN